MNWRRRYAMELCGCGDEAVGTNYLGHPVCKEHMDPEALTINPREDIDDSDHKPDPESEIKQKLLPPSRYEIMQKAREIFTRPTLTPQEFDRRKIEFGYKPTYTGSKTWELRYAMERRAGIAEDAESWLNNPIKIHRDHLKMGYPYMLGHPGCLDRTCPICPTIHKLQQEGKPIDPVLQLQWENAHCPSCGVFSINGHRCGFCENTVPFHDPYPWEEALKHQKECTGCEKHKRYHDYDPNNPPLHSGMFSRYCMGCGCPFQEGELDYGAEPHLRDYMKHLWETGQIRNFMELAHGAGTTDGGAAGFCRPCLYRYLPRVMTILSEAKWVPYPGGELPEGETPEKTFDTTHRIPETYCRNCGKNVGEGNSCPDCPKEQQCSCKGGTLF